MECYRENAATIDLEINVIVADKGEEKKRKSLIPSASSLVLELLGRAAESPSIMSTTHTSIGGIPLDHPPSVAVVTSHGSEMSLNNNSADVSMEDLGNSNDIIMNGSRVPVAAIPSATPSAGNPHSVVPQLMDIYDDLTQSSTPQTTNLSSMVTMPPLPPPSMKISSGPFSQGYGYGSNEEGGEGSSQASARNSRTRSSSGSTTLPTTSSIASVTSARGLRSKTKAKEPEPQSEEFPSSGSTGSGSGSGRQPMRKKGKSSNSDNRWSKRFTWPDELHRDFVSAIFDVGLKHASPSALMEFMHPNPEITSERVKSHLQKYRLNREKSRKEFMTNYDSALDGFQKRFEQLRNGEDEDDAEGAGSLSCGEVAAHCTHASLTELRDDDGKELSQRSSPAHGITSTYASQISTDGEGSGILQLPMLTSQEEDSPIGQAFGYLGGLYQALSQQLEEIRMVQCQGDRHQQDPQSLQPTLEQAAATAASMHANDPYINEVAACVPQASHSYMVGSQSVGELQNAPNSGGYHSSPPQYYRQHSSGTSGQVQGEQQYQQQQQYNYAAPDSHLAYSPLRKGVPATATNGRHQNYGALGHRKSQPHLEMPPLAHQAALKSGPSSPTIHIPKKPQTYGAKVSQEEYISHHVASHRTSLTQVSAAPNIPTITDVASNTTVNNSLSTGRTLQAQKESTLMKQEMRGQMAFQNKMRALMQIELSKSGVKEYAANQRRKSNTERGIGDRSAGAVGGGAVGATAPGCGGSGTTNSIQGQTDNATELSPMQHQVMPEDNEDSQSLIWNPEDDDQIFDFLMEHS